MSYSSGNFIEQSSIQFTNADTSIFKNYSNNVTTMTELTPEQYTVNPSAVVFTDTALAGGSNVLANTTLTTTGVAVGQVISFATGTGSALNNGLLRIVTGVAANVVSFNQPVPSVTDGNVITVYSVTTVKFGTVNSGLSLWLKGAVPGLYLVLNNTFVLPLNGFFQADMNYTSLALYNSTPGIVQIDSLLAGV